MINLLNLFKLFYFVIPFLFYIIPVILSYNTGDITFHFYTTHTFLFNDLVKIFLGHVLLGLIIINIFSKKGYLLIINKQSLLIDLLVVFIFIILSFFNAMNIINMLLFSLLIVLLSNWRPRNITFSILLIIALSQMVLNEDRFAVVFVLLLWLLPFLSNRSILTLFVLSLMGIFILIFGLQPMRYNELPFSNILNITDSLGYFYQHLSPIYMTAGLAQSIDFSTTSLFAEFIPFGKSLFGELGTVERLAREGLPTVLINEGTRLGSNSSMYFSWIGIVALIIMLSFIKFNMEVLKSRILTNSIFLYFISQGPYFIRRSFASFTIDIILIIFWVLFISGVLLIVKNKRIIKYEK